MKKGLKILSTSLLLTTLLVAGCSCDKADLKNVSRVENSADKLLKVGNKAIGEYTVLDLYQALTASDIGNKAVANKMIEFIANEVLELDDSESDWLPRYNKLIKEEMTKVAKSSTYLVNGEFSESYMAQSLRAEGYNIPTCSTYGTEEDLKCDYTDYINKQVKLNVLSSLLKQKYILEETLEDRKNLLTSKKIRDVEYFTISSSLDSTYKDFNTRNYMRELRNKIANGEVIDFALVEEEVKQKLKEIVEKEYNKIGTSDDYTKSIVSDYTNKFTQSKETGYKAKLDKIDDMEFNFAKLISSDSDKASIVDEAITSAVLSVTDPTSATFNRTVVAIENNNEVTSYYLINSNAGVNANAGDILLTNTSDSSTYTYSIVKFNVINSETTDNEEVYRAVELLAKETTLGNGAVAHYVKEYKNKINVYDDDVKTYLSTLYPDVFAE